MRFTVRSAELDPVLSEATTIASGMDAGAVLLTAIPHTTMDPVGNPDEEVPVSGYLKILAANNGIKSEWTLPASVYRPGMAVVHPDGPSKLVKLSKLSDKELEFNLTNPSQLDLTTVSSGSLHSFPTLSEDPFQDLPGFSGGNPLLDLSNIAEAIRFVKICAAKPGNSAGAQIANTGIHFRAGGSDEHNLDVVANDVSKLAIVSLDNGIDDYLDLGDRGHEGMTIPHEAIPLLLKALSEQCSLDVGEGEISVKGETVNLSIKLLEVPYIDYRPVIEQAVSEPYPYIVELDRKSFELAILRSASSISKGRRLKRAFLSGEESSGVVLVSDTDDGNSAEYVSSDDCGTFNISFDPSSMYDAVSSFSNSKSVTVAFGEHRAMKVTSPSEPSKTFILAANAEVS